MRRKPHKIKKRALALTLAAAVAVSTPMGALADTYDLSKGDIKVTVEKRKDENGEDTGEEDVWVKQTSKDGNGTETEYLSKEATKELKKAQNDTGEHDEQVVVPESTEDTIIEKIGYDDEKDKDEEKEEAIEKAETDNVTRVYDKIKGLLQTSPVKIKQENAENRDFSAKTDNTITVDDTSDGTAKFTLQNININLSESDESRAIDIGSTDTEITLSGYNQISDGNVHIDGNADVSLTIKGDNDPNTYYSYKTFVDENTEETVIVGDKLYINNSKTSGSNPIRKDAALGTDARENLSGNMNITLTDDANVEIMTSGYFYSQDSPGAGANIGTGGSADITGTLSVTAEDGSKLYSNGQMNDGAAIGTGENGSLADGGTIRVTAEGENSAVNTGGNIGTGTLGSIAGTVEVTADDHAIVSAGGCHPRYVSAGIGTKTNNEKTNSAYQLKAQTYDDALDEMKTQKGITATGKIKVTAENGATVNAYGSSGSYADYLEGGAGIGTGGQTRYYYKNGTQECQMGYGGNNIAGAIEVRANSGGTVNAIGTGGAGIGTGENGSIEHSGSITIGGNGGTVNANVSYGGGAGVGTGEYQYSLTRIAAVTDGSMQGTIKVGENVTLNARGGNTNTESEHVIGGNSGRITYFTSPAGGAGIGTGALIINESKVLNPAQGKTGWEARYDIVPQGDTETLRSNILGALHKLSGHIVISDNAVVNATGAFGAAGIGTGSDMVIHNQETIDANDASAVNNALQKIQEQLEQAALAAAAAGDTVAYRNCKLDGDWLKVALQYMTNEFTHDDCKTTDSCEGGDAQADPYLETVNIKDNAQVTATSGHEWAASIGTGVIQCAYQVSRGFTAEDLDGSEDVPEFQPVNSIYSIQRINGRTTLRDHAKVNLYVDNNYDGAPDTIGGISDGNGMRLGFIGSSATIARDGTGAAQGGTWDEGPDEFVKYEIWHGVTLNGHYLCYDSGSDLSTAAQDELMANAVHYTKNDDGTPHNFVFHCHHTDEEENGDHKHETPVVPVVPVVPVTVTEMPVAPAAVQTVAAEGEAAAAPAAAPAASAAPVAAKLPQTGAPVLSALGLALSGVALGIGSLFTKGKHEK